MEQIKIIDSVALRIDDLRDAENLSIIYGNILNAFTDLILTADSHDERPSENILIALCEYATLVRDLSKIKEE